MPKITVQDGQVTVTYLTITDDWDIEHDFEDIETVWELRPRLDQYLKFQYQDVLHNEMIQNIISVTKTNQRAISEYKNKRQFWEGTAFIS